MEKRLQERITEICDSGGFAAGYRYRGPALSRDYRAAAAHEVEATAFAAEIAGSVNVQVEDRAEALLLGKSAFKAGYMRGRAARVSIPPLALDVAVEDGLQVMNWRALQALAGTVEDSPGTGYHGVGETPTDESADRPHGARSPNRS